MARKTKEEAAATREDILDAALACFHEHGVAGTTLAMIASRAGYTRGAVYWHFKNKAEVIEAMMERERVPFIQRMERTSSPLRDTPIQDLRMAILVSLGELADDASLRSLMEIMLRYELTDDSKTITQIMRDNEREEMDMVVRTLRRAQELGQLREGADITTASRVLSLSMTGVMYSSMVAPDLYEIRRDGMATVDAILSAYVKEGVFTPGVMPDPKDGADWLF